MRPHVHMYACDSLIINDDTGPKCTLLSSVQFEEMGYRWESSRSLWPLTVPDGTKIPLTRNRYNDFWYFNTLKIHHDTDLTRKEITRQFRHYKTTSLYLSLTLMTKYKKSNINSQTIVVSWWVTRHTQDLNDEGDTTNGSNIILGMTTKSETPDAVLTLINLRGTPKRIHNDNTSE